MCEVFDVRQTSVGRLRSFGRKLNESQVSDKLKFVGHDMGGHNDQAYERANTDSGVCHLAICLVSGGMDSCVTAAIARAENDELAFLHVSYGQRTARRERRACDELAAHFEVTQRLVASIDYLTKIGGSSLTDTDIVVTEADLASREIPTSYVPFRNSHLLSIAASWAEVISAGRIYIGAVSEDSSGYPDCRPDFYQAFQRAIDVGTKPETQIEIVTPVIHMRKSEIVKRGLELGAPLGLTWSCYSSEDKACGRCDSCALRLRAFSQAGVPDPIEYA